MIRYLTNLRAFAILAVIALHTTAPLLHEKFNSQSWWFGNLVDGSVRWSVPVFIMVSGALLLGKDEPLNVFFKKRALKIGIPFVFWVSFYIFFSLRHHIGDLTTTKFIKQFFSGDPYFHLWFMYMIVGLYLLTPILRKITYPENKSIMLYFLIIWAVISTLFPAIGHYLHYQVGFNFYFFTGFSGVFLLGYYLHHFSISKRIKWIIYFFALFSWIFTIVGTYFTSLYFHKFDAFWYEYMDINIILISMGLFLFFKDYLNHWNSKLVSLISKMSFGIYLIHPVFITLFSSDLFYHAFGFHLNCYYINPVIGSAGAFIAVVVSSSLAIYVLQKIPFIKMIVP